jgi:aminopeptidase
MNTKLLESCKNIIEKNMGYTWDQELYLLYDVDSPLAEIVSNGYSTCLEGFKVDYPGAKIHIREFTNPPQPLYRGGMINPENPHSKEQNRVITAHNITENINVWLDHHKKIEVKNEEVVVIDPQIESIKNSLTSLPKNSIVILVQSTNFRLSTFRIRLELFHRWIHVVEHNHLAYIKEIEYDTFIDSLIYRTDEYLRLEHEFSKLSKWASESEIISSNGSVLTFWALENIRGNTGDYTGVENKWGTFPIGEIFTEAVDLSSVHGKCLIDTFPNEDFSINICEPFELIIENWRVLPSQHFPARFQRLYDFVVQFEGEVMVRELWFGLNPAISSATPLSDINFHERKVWVHLSLWKKHGIYGKKLPKSEVQRFHIDVFVALESVLIGGVEVFSQGKWTV